MRERERTRGIGVYLVLLHVDGSCGILGRKLGREQFPKPSCLLDVDAAVRVCTIGTVARDRGRGEYVSGMGSSEMLGATGKRAVGMETDTGQHDREHTMPYSGLKCSVHGPQG